MKNVLEFRGRSSTTWPQVPPLQRLYCWRQGGAYRPALADVTGIYGKLNGLYKPGVLCKRSFKAALIHFYIAYLHPWFDGNGRMARLIHLWYLVQQRYSSALFVPLSKYVEKSRRDYYNAYTLTEQNARLSGIMDVTPFLVYFIENVYYKLVTALPASSTMDAFQKVLEQGDATEKEKALWQFVLAAYGESQFSTKQLEKNF